MVLLTITPAAKSAIGRYCALASADSTFEEDAVQAKDLAELETGSPIEHEDLIQVSSFLLKHAPRSNSNAIIQEWRLGTLLKGANVYQAPPPPKPEPTSEYKALMQRLRAEEEQRVYDRMVNPPPAHEPFNQRYTDSGQFFNPATSIGQSASANEVDEITYADVNRQLGLIINVLISIVCCAVAIWVAARRWDVPQRLGLSMSGSGLVAVAEVAIYMGYIRRIKEAKTKEKRVVETKEIVETWVLDGSKGDEKSEVNETVRYRNGKHR